MEEETMEWDALLLSLKLGVWVVLILLPLGVIVGRWLAWHHFAGKGWVEALLALPLVLPPTVLGYYWLVTMGQNSFLGDLALKITGTPVVFTFFGLVVTSIFVNLPFAIQPMQRAFEAIPREIREAGFCCGLSSFMVFWRIELPLAWPGILTALVLSFAHTLGEFGVVLMVGGNIPQETRTIALAIYDRVEAFDHQAAGVMSAFLLLFSLVTLGLSYALSAKIRIMR